MEIGRLAARIAVEDSEGTAGNRGMVTSEPVHARSAMKDIVGETSDLIEQLCIEAALDLTRDNRAAAAEMLGLSRQSLYVKLRRYGMSDPRADNEK